MGIEDIKKLEVRRNRNAAIVMATGDFLAFVDDDISVATDWLACMLAECRDRWHSNPVLITGPILLPRGSTWSSGTARQHTLRRRVFADPPDTADVLYSGHFGSPRTVFQKLGPRAFDTRFGPGGRVLGAEDADFGYRALQASISIVYEPSVRATHWEVVALRPRRGSRYGFGCGAVTAKHLRAGWKSGWRLLFKTLASNGAKARRSLFSGYLGEAAGRAAAVVGIGLGFLQWSVLYSLNRLPKDA